MKLARLLVSRPRSMLANAGALFMSRLVVAALGWAGTILIIRHLDQREWGQFTFVFGFLGLVSVVSNVVNSRVAVHGIMHDDAERFAGAYVVLRMLFGLVAYVIAMAYVVVAGYPEIVVEATAIAGIALLLATPSNAYDAVFQASFQMDRVAVALVVGQVAQFALTAVLAFTSRSFILFTIPAVLCEVVVIALKLRWVRPLQRVRYRVDLDRWRAMMREAVPLAIGGGLAMAYYSIDAVLLSRMDTFRAVGTYGIAYKFAGVLGFLPQALAAAVLPILARAWPSDPDGFRRSVRRAGTTLLLAAMLVLVVFGLFSREIITLLYGRTYQEADDATRLVLAGECLGFFTSLAVTTYAAMSRNRWYPVAALCGLVFNVGLNLVLIPSYSFLGASWATLATEVLVVIVLWIPLRRVLGAGPCSPLLVARAGIAAALAAGAGAAAWLVAPWYVAAVLATGVYAGLILLVRTPEGEGVVGLLRGAEDLSAARTVSP